MRALSSEHIGYTENAPETRRWARKMFAVGCRFRSAEERKKNKKAKKYRTVLIPIAFSTLFAATVRFLFAVSKWSLDGPG